MPLRLEAPDSPTASGLPKMQTGALGHEGIRQEGSVVSTGLECHFVERKPDKWFYILQEWDCPVGMDDWREYATTYGPFRSLEKAHEHLRVHHANPGGWSEFPLGSGYVERAS